jgi:protein TonB
MQNVPKPPDPAPDQTPPPQPEVPVTPPDVYPGMPINDPGTPAPIGIPPVAPPSVPPGPAGPEIPATMRRDPI